MSLVLGSGRAIDFFAVTVRVPAGLMALCCGHLYNAQRGEISCRLFKSYPLATILTLFKPMLIQDIFGFSLPSPNSYEHSDLASSSLLFFNNYMARHFLWLYAE